MASATLQVKVPLGQLARTLYGLKERGEKAYKRGLRSAAMRARTIMDAATVTAPPASPNGTRGAVNTGAYRRAWKVEPTADGIHIYSLSPYAGVIEYGRRPGARMPPSYPEDVIARWAQRKLGLPYKRAKAVSFLIRRAIARRGLAPRRVLTSPNTVAFLSAALRGEVEREIMAEWRRRP